MYVWNPVFVPKLVFLTYSNYTREQVFKSIFILKRFQIPIDLLILAAMQPCELFSLNVAVFSKSMRAVPLNRRLCL